MKRILLTLALVAATAVAPNAMAQLKWQPGKHYTVIPQQRSLVPAGKVEVMEVFSYGCPACNQFRPVMKQLSAGLPKNAQMTYLPASWQAAENWPTFQRAYLTAVSLGIADKAHDAMYDAIWKTGELGIADPNTRQLKKVLPSMEDIAKFYERVAGVKKAAFVAASKSFAVDLKIKQAEAQIKAMQVLSTPTLIVAGKYRVNNEAFRTVDEIIEMVNFLVAKETPAAAPAAAANPAASAKPAVAPVAAKPVAPAKP
ncbi:MAG TPA: thiol:disulfide interchange protein DsbA/DsbL [Steroidobacteraceae bacterium]|nr:thiol:disulfide interchange protein DsbA/DsbL [Steroidobacteraceae bacterium]